MKEIILAVIAIILFAISFHKGGNIEYVQTGMITLILAIVSDLKNKLDKNDKI